MTEWQPSAALAIQQQRATTMAAIRQFFAGNSLEVDAPCLGTAGVTDLHIDNISASVNSQPAYLQSSPEYFMKRMLAAGSGDIYYLGKAFRDHETGSRHNPEFTILEWYRLGWTEQQLMDEVANLIARLSPQLSLSVNRFHYAEIVHQVTGVNPHSGKLSQLQELAEKITGRDFTSESRSTCLDLIFSLLVEPALPAGLTLIDHYPSCQSALAKLGEDDHGNTIALRFEAFIDGIELANGYCELTNPVELRHRFEADQKLRQQVDKPTMEIDQKFMAALEYGLPECSGVALGVDRLLMYLAKTDCIQDVLAFPFNQT